MSTSFPPRDPGRPGTGHATAGPRHQRMNQTRMHLGLSVAGLWMRYLAIGGTADPFDVDAYLHGLSTLAPLQQDVLAHALHEALMDLPDPRAVPQSTVQLDRDRDPQ